MYSRMCSYIEDIIFDYDRIIDLTLAFFDILATYSDVFWRQM